ncbi:TPA: hypothetical protein DD449_01420 [Candidatus Berkelbacteria bacterium]|uniref:Uncharacterized protein n=1 Tax=Berkelbacteria bacterium GW2011_GWE1_39_12 TaxID=1618337 RepID=A0A0G4B6E5_9BACT|nr:MAG: hypothetical protein UT28_C0001G0802 [Berkelbacteria bacterium GW2011_GWE1_39_12]HBO60329.1 hypothetical protein [Candidatus Berkelbacteria bacterium]
MKLFWKIALDGLPVITSLLEAKDGEFFKIIIDEETADRVIVKAKHCYHYDCRQLVYSFYFYGKGKNIKLLTREISRELGTPLISYSTPDKQMQEVIWLSEYCGSPRSIYERTIPSEVFDEIVARNGLSLFEVETLCQFLAESEIQTRGCDRILSYCELDLTLPSSVRTNRIYDAALEIERAFELINAS